MQYHELIQCHHISGDEQQWIESQRRFQGLSKQKTQEVLNKEAVKEGTIGDNEFLAPAVSSDEEIELVKEMNSKENNNVPAIEENTLLEAKKLEEKRMLEERKLKDKKQQENFIFVLLCAMRLEIFFFEFLFSRL